MSSSFSKPHGSNVHFSVTTYEPYGVCCIQGLKISMGMHNFGEKRWGVGLLDDVSSFACDEMMLCHHNFSFHPLLYIADS